MKKQLPKSILFLAVSLMMATSVWGDVTPQSYCDYVISQSEGKSIKITWQTLRNGDIRIDIADNEGVSETTFRNGAFEGGMNGFKVLSGEGYATEEVASTYFTREWAEDSPVFYLRKRSGVTLPSPCVVQFSTNAMAWKNDADGNAYKFLTFTYEYGTNCQSIAAPTNVAITATGRVSFNEVAGADNYEVTIYDGATLIHSQDIAKNDILDFVATSTTTLSVYVRAIKGDYAGPRSNEYEWAVEAGHVYAHSHYCDKTMGVASTEGTIGNPSTEQNSLIGFTWETKRNGDVLITISEKEEGSDPGTTLFRGNGMHIAAFQIAGVANDGEDAIFETEATHANLNYYTLKLKEGKSAPANGTHITYNTTVEYKTATTTNAWPTLSFDYVYGTKCSSEDGQNPVISAFAATPDKSSITFHVEASDVDDEDTDQTSLLTYHVVNAANGIDQDVVLDGSGNFTLSGLKKNIISSYTLTATDPSENSASRTIDVAMDFDTEDNLAKDKTCSAGGYEGENGPSKANDGNTGSYWGTYNVGDFTTKNYWEVDLGTAYVLSRTVINRGVGGDSHAFTLQGKMNEGDAWTTIFEDFSVAANTSEEKSFIASARYLRFNALQNSMVAVKEFEVYGTAFAAADATNPTVTVTCPTKTINSATLQVNATDKDDLGGDGAIRAVHISGDNGFVTQRYVTLNGSNQITLSGLTYNTTYTFTVTVVDLAGNEASTNITVRLPLNTNFNLAEGKEAVAGKIQDGNIANYGCDGNTGTTFSTYGTQDQSKEYWYVDLEDIYTIRQVAITWGNDYAVHFLIQGATTLPAEENREDDSYWTTYLDYTYASDPGSTKQEHALVGKMRYLRLKSLQNEIHLGINFKELEVYGSDYAELDNVAPYITTEGCTTNTKTAEATLTLVAEDAVDGAIKDFYISCADPVMPETKYTTDEYDHIVIGELEIDKDYTFNIRFRDLSGNWRSTTLIAHFAMALGTNVAVGKTATAGREEGAHTADKAVDDNNATYWGNYNDNVDLEGGINWWKVDLVNGFKLENIAIKWEHYPDNGGIIIEGSLNDVNYSEIISYSGDRFSQHDRQVLEITGEQATIPYRYIRIKAENQAKFMSFYEFEVYASEEIPLLTFEDDSDSEYNKALIAAHNGETSYVVINRTIEADDTWYTLCLPFDMNAAKVREVFGESQIAELIDTEEKENGSVVRLNFAFVDAIVAGKPYMIKVGQTFDAGTSISSVTIKNVGPTETGDSRIKFIGTYDQKVLNQENQRFVADENNLYSPAADGTTMGAFRCYFTIPEGSPLAGAPGVRAYIVFGSQAPMGMDAVQQTVTPSKIMLNGVLYIIRDGKTYTITGIEIQ